MPVELLAAAKILKKPLDDLYEMGKDKFKSELEKWKFDSNINELYRHVFNIQKVKTIWQFDKEVNLKSFYYPSKIIIDNESVIVNSLKKIPNSSNCIIQGIVGQGKSIFMRYLCSQEIKIGETVPIFLECRKIEDNETLQDNIFQVLKSYGFNITSELFDFLCNSGKITLMIDGFDELSLSKTPNIISELESLSILYPHLKIIVSSRPDSGIERSAYFRIYKLAKLDRKDLPKILNKLVDDNSKVKNIVEVVLKSSTDIGSLLTTPLMVSLLVIVYKAEQKIPEQFSDFYETLFLTLLYRHDKSKPGYVRPRKSNLNERKLQKVFEAFCFISSQEHKVTMTDDEINSYIEKAFSYVQVENNTNNVIHDIVKITNLVVEEGYKYHFIHKSIQEFHAAYFIKDRNDETARNFYKYVMNSYENWSQEIEFLSQIDKYRYLKYLYIPSHNEVFKALGMKINELEQDINNDLFVEILNDIEIGIDLENNHFKEMSLVDRDFTSYYSKENFFHIIFKYCISILASENIPNVYNNSKKNIKSKKKNIIHITLANILVDNDLFNDCYSKINKIYREQFKEYQEYKLYIEGEEKLEDIFVL